MTARSLIPAVLLAAPLIGTADDNEVKGVNPAENLTKFEIIPKFTRIDDGDDISLWTTTLKYDRAINGVWGVNVELPLGYFDAPFLDETGIGDLNIRGRYQHRAGSWTYIGGVEAVFPIATDDVFGGGKFQLNPTVVAVKAFSPQTFMASVAKHSFSIAGEDDRDDIVTGQYRVILAHTTKSGWWFLADPQLWVDYENGSRIHFAPEAEIGKMIGKSTGIWLRGGGHVAGDWEKDDWSISGGIRFISF